MPTKAIKNNDIDKTYDVKTFTNSLDIIDDRKTLFCCEVKLNEAVSLQLTVL